MPTPFPTLRSVVLDTTSARGLAEFYRQLLGYDYRPGDECPPAGRPDPAGEDWLVLLDPAGHARVAFQQVGTLTPSTWPADGVPQQLHLDLGVPTVEALAAQHERALSLGARLLQDRSEDAVEPLYVYADPAGHPFCILVADPRSSTPEAPAARTHPAAST
ncbi:MAG: VOC family protein [Acidimicrobiales bacterium]